MRSSLGRYYKVGKDDNIRSNRVRNSKREWIALAVLEWDIVNRTHQGEITTARQYYIKSERTRENKT